MIKGLACASAVLLGLIVLETQGWRENARPVIVPARALAPALPRHAASPDAAKSVAVILARPLFSPGRRPAPPVETGRKVPRLAGLVLAPSLRLALLQVSDAAGMRPVPVSTGGMVAGWRVAGMDAAGVLLVGYGQTLRLTPKPAGARPIPPKPIEQIVIMPTKRTNPQLAW